MVTKQKGEVHKMYAKIENGSVSAYPYTFGLLKKDYPNTSFPADSLSRSDIQAERNVVEVVLLERPEVYGHNVSEGTPELIKGKWTQVWNSVLRKPSEVPEGEIVGSELLPKQDGKVAFHKEPEWDGTQWNRAWGYNDATWLESRLAAYGPESEQIEFITENGLEAWQTKVSEIKTKYPKP